MKKLILNLCTLLACCGASASDTWVVNNDGDTIWYDFDQKKKTASVTFKGIDYKKFKNEYSDTIAIPEKVEYNGTEYKVTSIGASAFSGCYKKERSEVAAEEVMLIIGEIVEDGIYDESTNRKNHEDYEANGLKYVSIPNSVTKIGDEAFFQCKNLTNVLLPDSIKQIGREAFSLCSSLNKVTIPKGVTSIKYKAFYNCENLKSILMQEGITTIGREAFENCYNLTNITLPNSLTEIGYEAFCKCEKLVDISVPEGVKSIESRAFYRCVNLTNITLPSSLTEIEDETFSTCEKLTSITIPKGVKTIGKGAFCICRSLKNVLIPNSVTNIGDVSFYGCENLKNVSIPNSVTTIGALAFANCNMNNIEVSKDNPNYCSENGVLFDKPKTTLIQYPNGKKGKYTIPNGVAKIKSGAFTFSSDLTSLTIPNSLTEIEIVSMHSGREDTFDGCSKLYEIYNFSSLNITPGSKEHGGVALYAKDVHTSKNADSKLKQVGDFTFYVTKDSIELLAYTGNATSVKLPQNFNGKKYQIAASAFVWNRDMKSVTIPNGVTKIGKLAFAECRGLKNITIPNSVTEIEERAFANCTALESVAISASVTKIETLTFYGCSKLKSVTIPSKVTMVGWGAFRLCSSLKEITIPKSVKVIRSEAFAECGALKSITSWNTTPPEISQSTFSSVSKTIPVYVPAESVETYKKADGWSEFCNIVATSAK